ncbi:MAG: 50S ribosomal protein L9 [Candidatus Cardinium sp.]|nr:50S ribosomal protein L9 [Candidatus Cardinium sp.]
MEIILKSAYKALGKKGDIVTVKPGYGRNYLIPQGIAVVANETNRKVAAEDARQAAGKTLKLKTDAQGMAAYLTTIKVVLRAKVGEGGYIFGAITPLQIAQALKEKNVMVDYTNIKLPVAIKQLGSYQATLTLHEMVTYTLHFDVVAA